LATGDPDSSDHPAVPVSRRLTITNWVLYRPLPTGPLVEPSPDQTVGKVSTVDFQEEKMSKLSMTATFAAILVTAMPVAYAQTRAAPETHAAVTGGEPGRIIQPNQIRASKMIGSKMIGSSIYDVQNRNIGSVKDLVLDSDGRVAAVVVDVGSFLGVGGKYVAISMSDTKRTTTV
jgi:sporulation protein YlmC with PRC-barrel domain